MDKRSSLFCLFVIDEVKERFLTSTTERRSTFVDNRRKKFRGDQRGLRPLVSTP